MTTNNRIGYAQGGGGGSGEGENCPGEPQSVYRTRGVIDANEARLPNANDVTNGEYEAVVGLNAFVYSSAGTPPAGVLGATSVNPGDYIVYLSGDPTLAASWVAVNNPSLLSVPGMFSNAVSNWVRVVGIPGAGSGVS